MRRIRQLLVTAVVTIALLLPLATVVSADAGSISTYSGRTTLLSSPGDGGGTLP